LKTIPIVLIAGNPSGKQKHMLSGGSLYNNNASV
jgi:hypothetical protein